jgi:hypothetical protein
MRITVSEAAKHFNITEYAILKSIIFGDIQHERVPGTTTLLVEVADVKKVAEERRRLSRHRLREVVEA